ncbi:MAG: anthranilate phosphoribosyltransferase [Acidimicrobiales bacterium]|nr:anthranilate phosphoribosyltransferase [Acidimicrobiales bacterium]
MFSALIKHDDLTRAQANWAMNEILSGQATPAQIGGFLIGLKSKGETVEELMGLVTSMVSNGEVCEVENSENLVDTCGTGGDRSGTFNISTCAALVIAGAGVKVAKHGNRAATSKSGSADVLEELGVAINLSAKGVAHCINSVGFGFFLAQRFHSAMRHASPIRSELGVPTAFNLLGPLSNPAKAGRQLIGVADRSVAEKMREVLAQKGTKHAFIVHSDEGLDEISTVGSTWALELKRDESGNILKGSFEINPGDFGFDLAEPADLKGGDPKENAEIVKSILGGTLGPKRDVVLLNAGAALVIADIAKDIEEGIEVAKTSIESGQAAKTLQNLVKESNWAREL